MIGFKIIVEVEGTQTSIDSMEQLKGLYSFIGSFIRLAVPPVNGISTTPRTAPTTTPARSVPRLIDYAIRAGSTFHGEAFTLKDLVERMEAMGWQSDSTDKPNTVRSTIRQYPFFQSSQDGYWRFVRSPQRSVSPPPEDTEDETLPEGSSQTHA